MTGVAPLDPHGTSQAEVTEQPTRGDRALTDSAVRPAKPPVAAATAGCMLNT